MTETTGVSKPKSRLDPAIIRRSDFVEILVPRRFVRVGYPLTKEICANQLETQHGDEIEEFLKKLGIRGAWRGNTSLTKRPNHRSWDRLLDQLGYMKCASDHFGGRERQIFTEPVDEAYQNTVAQVHAIYYVNTGTHFGSSGGYDSYSGEYYYESGGLHNMARHKILKVGGSFKHYPGTHVTQPIQVPFKGYLVSTDVRKWTREDAERVSAEANIYGHGNRYWIAPIKHDPTPPKLSKDPFPSRYEQFDDNFTWKSDLDILGMKHVARLKPEADIQL